MVSNHNLDITLSKNLGGYILIELLLVIAIVALIATATISPWTKWIDSIRLEQGARQLAATLRLLQNRAMTEEKTFYFRFVLHEGTRWGYLVRETDDSGSFTGEVIFRPLPRGVRLDYFSGKPKELLLYPTGAPSQGATIRLANTRGKTIKLTIVPATGRVQIQ